MKGILFSQPMVIAWNEGKKLVTRRLIKPPTGWEIEQIYNDKCQISSRNSGLAEFKSLNPYYRPGEIVYIKETWAVHLCAGRETEQIHHKAVGTYCPIDGEKLKWKSPLFMPEWASRSHALIMSVKPEKIQEITEKEAIREGCYHRASFIDLWEFLHPGSWSENSWVWRIELKKMEG